MFKQFDRDRAARSAPPRPVIRVQRSGVSVTPPAASDWPAWDALATQARDVTPGEVRHGR